MPKKWRLVLGRFASYTLVVSLTPKTIHVFPLTWPTLVFCADPAIFMAFQKKKKKIIPTDSNIFQKIGQTTLKMSELQK